MAELRFDGRVAIVTGAGGGLGREYAVLLASRGAKVVVNDLGGSRDGQGSGSSAADRVVQEIRSAGGQAVPNYDSVENGAAIVKTAIDNYGRIDIVINNAGILRDKSFAKITDDEWDLVHRVHLRGAYQVTKAAWPYMRDQKFGRIVMTSSSAGIYGNFGQTNYSSAKLGLVGLSNTLAIEGAKYDIHCNAIVPVAASRLTEDVLPKQLFDKLNPASVAPVVAWLVHENCPETGGIIEAAGGWVGRYRWQRSAGKAFTELSSLTPESVRDTWGQIISMEQGTYPSTTHEQMTLLMNALSGEPSPAHDSSTSTSAHDSESSQFVTKFVPGLHKYTAEDAILYALGVGMSTAEPDHLKFLYECSDRFQVLPTYGVIPSIRSVFEYGTIQEAMKQRKLKWDPAKLLHGEQYLELRAPIPSSGVLITKPRIIEVLDKGVGALVIVDAETTDEDGKPILYSQFALMMVGSGNFGGQRTSNNPLVKPVVDLPNRQPDVSVTEKTSIDQAALYRLSGDKNPLHIDPTFAAVGGFEKPILHGLCSLGFATRHILKAFCDNDVKKFQSVKARFVGPITPGQTIQTDMWREGNRIYFQCLVKETGKATITGSYVDLVDSLSQELGAGTENDPLTASAADGDEENFLLSDVVFDEMGRRAKLLPNVCSDVNAVFQFEIIKNDKHAVTWIFNLKHAPAEMYQGTYRGPGEPDCTVRIGDEDMVELGMGVLDPVRGFMSGRIKVTGNPLLTQRLNKLFELDSTDHMDGVIKADEVAAIDAENASSENGEFRFSNYNHDIIYSEPVSKQPRWEAAPYDESSYEPPVTYWAQSGGGSDGGGGGDTGCKTDLIFGGWLKKRLAQEVELVPHIKTCYQWNLTKNGKVVSVWTLDIKNPPGAVYRGPPKGARPDCSLTIDDEYAVEIFEGREDAMKAFMTGKLKITGNILAAQKLQQLWSEEQASKTGDSLDSTLLTPSQTSASINSEEDKALMDSIPTSGLKSDIVFNVFKNRMHEEPELVRRLRVIFQFIITKNGEQKAVWTADNKSTEEGDVFPGTPKNGLKPDCTVTVDDDDFLKLMVGKLNPQRAFMMGKLKIKGNIMLLQKLNSLWIEFQKSGKAPELPILSDIMLKENVIPGLRSEAMIVELVQRMARMPNLLAQAPGYAIINVTKDGKQATKYTVDLKTRQIGCAYRGDPQGGQANAILTMEDDDFVRLVFHKLKMSDAISSGRVKCEGDKGYLDKIDVIFSTPTTKARL